MISRMIGTSVFSDGTEFSVTTADSEPHDYSGRRILSRIAL
jgi:hypothetical protein